MHLRFALIAALLLAAVSVSFIDVETAMEHRVRDVIAKYHWQGTYENLGEGWFEFTGTDGLTWKRNFGDVRTQGGLQPKKIISIDLRTLDTTGYGVYLQEVGRIHLGNSSNPPIGSRLGSDGLCELTGTYFEFGLGDKKRMLRRKPGTFEFELVSILDASYFQIESADLDLNGIPEIIGDSSGCVVDFEAPTIGSRDINHIRSWVGKAGVRQVPRIEDLDNDGYPEVLMYQFGLGLHGVAIVKYSPATNRLESVLRYEYPNTKGFRGYYAVGDFDMDGHKEFVTAKMDGEVCFMENGQGESDYRLAFVDTTRYVNAFYHTEGNDLDGDGRPECLIGSDDSFGMCNIAVYETIGNDKYEVTCWIEVFPIGGWAWEWIWTGDIDGDKKDEIVLSSEGTIVVLRAFGVADYRVIWYKRISSDLSHRLFDIDNDGTQEILLSFIEDKVHQTMILRHPVTVGMKDAPIVPDKLECSISPQPASGNGNTLLHVTGSSAIHLSVRSIAGREMHERTIEASSSGRHTIPLQLRGYPSGVYYAVLTAGKATIVRKFQVIQ